MDRSGFLRDEFTVRRVRVSPSGPRVVREKSAEYRITVREAEKLRGVKALVKGSADHKLAGHRIGPGRTHNPSVEGSIPSGPTNICPGQGHVSLPLALRGFSITCVELGPQLTKAARRNLPGFSNVEVIEAQFERWVPPQRPAPSTGCLDWSDGASLPNNYVRERHRPRHLVIVGLRVENLPLGLAWPGETHRWSIHTLSPGTSAQKSRGVTDPGWAAR